MITKNIIVAHSSEPSPLGRKALEQALSSFCFGFGESEWADTVCWSSRVKLLLLLRLQGTSILVKWGLPWCLRGKGSACHRRRGEFYPWARKIPWRRKWQPTQVFSSVQSLSLVWLFATPWTAAYQASLSITNSQRLLKLMSIESMMPSNHFILCCPLLLPSIFPSIRVFSKESVLCIRWPKY